MYDRNPKSRVFAPLAETYRKLGMHDEALKILRNGIKRHPNYTLGYIVLSNIYYDKEQYEIAYTTLRPFISENLENITLQKLFANICVNLGYLEEALNTFKCLLLINPKDEEVATQVKLLEDDLLVPDEIVDPSGYVEKRESIFDADDDWVQVNFSENNQRKSDVNKKSIESWEVKNSTDSSVVTEDLLDGFKSDVLEGKLEVSEHSLDDEYFYEDHDIEADEVIEAEFSEENEDDKTQKDDSPIITHTLVDLYCKQGYFEKALELLDNILELHPNDEKTIAKRVEVREFVDDGKSEIQDHGHEKLLSLVDEAELQGGSRVDLELESKKKETLRELEEKLHLFFKKLEEKSYEKNPHH